MFFVEQVVKIDSHTYINGVLMYYVKFNTRQKNGLRKTDYYSEKDFESKEIFENLLEEYKRKNDIIDIKKPKKKNKLNMDDKQIKKQAKIYSQKVVAQIEEDNTFKI